MAIIRDMLAEINEPTMEDVKLAKANKEMQRRLLKRKLSAFEAGEQELQRQEGLANNPQFMMLNDRMMVDPQGRPVFSPDSVAAKNLMRNPYAQLELLTQGATAAQVPQIAGQVTLGRQGSADALMERALLMQQIRERLQQ